MFPSISLCKPEVEVRIFSDEKNNTKYGEFVEGETLCRLKSFNRNVTKYITHWAISV